MNLNEMTIGEAKEIAGLFNSKESKSCSLEIGKKYFIRTVTHYYTGKLISITDSDFVLEDAAWIADTGRFYEALKTGKLNEVEPFLDNAIVFRGGIVDACEWPHDLPKEQK